MKECSKSSIIHLKDLKASLTNSFIKSSSAKQISVLKSKTESKLSKAGNMKSCNNIIFDSEKNKIEVSFIKSSTAYIELNKEYNKSRKEEDTLNPIPRIHSNKRNLHSKNISNDFINKHEYEVKEANIKDTWKIDIGINSSNIIDCMNIKNTNTNTMTTNIKNKSSNINILKNLSILNKESQLNIPKNKLTIKNLLFKKDKRSTTDLTKSKSHNYNKLSNTNTNFNSNNNIHIQANSNSNSNNNNNGIREIKKSTTSINLDPHYQEKLRLKKIQESKLTTDQKLNMLFHSENIYFSDYKQLFQNISYDKYKTQMKELKKEKNMKNIYKIIDENIDVNSNVKRNFNNSKNCFLTSMEKMRNVNKTVLIELDRHQNSTKETIKTLVGKHRSNAKINEKVESNNVHYSSFISGIVNSVN